MARNVSTAVDAALSADYVPMLVLVDMDFSSGHLRATNAGHAFTWAGNEYIGLGNLGGIGIIEEGVDLEARGLTLTLAGVNPSLISIALGEQYQGRSVLVYFAPLNQSHQIIADPVLVFSGRMDTMDIEIGATGTITVTAESRLADWDRPRVRRYNHEDQIAVYPNDRGLEYVPEMVEKELIWGRT